MVPSPLVPKHPFRVSLAGEIQLDDFDAIREVSPEWDQDHVQIGRGRQAVRATVVQTARMQVACISRGPGARIQGTPPRGTVALAIALRGHRLQLRGRPLDRGIVGVQPDGSEFELVAPAPHSELVLAVDRRLLDEGAWERWGCPFPSGVTGGVLRLRDPDALRRILRTSARWLRAARASPAMVCDPASVARLESEVLAAYLDGIDPGPLPIPVGPRRELAHKAESFLRASLREPIRLQDVCDAVGASSRAVHAAFQVVYGIPPKAYLKALRLSAARAALRGARPGVTVSEIAARFGFFQHGYFSVDYRKMFGERPRETLRGAKAARTIHVVRRPVKLPAA
jgi:AraC family transcriptional regulator, ethanolamine operon transcriptional activator